MTSPCASISSPTSWNSCLQKHWKLDVFAATNTLSRTVVKTSSTSVWDCTHSTSSGSTKCYHVLELIGKCVCAAQSAEVQFIGLNYHFLVHRLQTGMRGAFGKPLGTVARVHIGQPIMSVRSNDRFKAQVIEALRRAKFKFPGRQKVCQFPYFFGWRNSKS